MFYIYLFVGIVLFTAVLAGLSSAPYVPMRKKDLARFLDIADIKKGDIVYDLGCGDGRVLMSAKKMGAKAIGLELAALNYLYCKIFNRGVDIRFKNFFYEEYKDADIVYMFLSKKTHNFMGKILREQMKSGSKIICYVWSIDGWEPEKINKKEKSATFYLYIV